jgi:carbamoyltransferase
MRVLGFSVGHDKGAVIIENAKVLIGITQERLTRIKHDGAHQGGLIPIESIKYCLENTGLTFRDIDLFVYSTTEVVDDVLLKFRQAFGINISDKSKFLPHHLAHAYSSFFSSGFDDAVVVVADASGSILSEKNKLSEWYPDFHKEGLSDDEYWTEGISIYHFTKSDSKEVYKKWIKYPVPINTNEDVSVGTVYSEGSLQLIYEPNTHSWPAGKLMGLASYANKELVDEAPEYIVETEDGDIFIPNNTIYPNVTHDSDFFSRAVVAGIYQREQERVSLMLAKKGKELTKSENICVAGGSFLNCNSNEQILNSGLFEGCYFIPPSDDSGIPLGCAWYGYQLLSPIEEIKPLSPYLGKEYTKNDIVSALNEYPLLGVTNYENFDELIEDVSFWLSQNRVVGWFQGGSEIGPRALGNRSILASPIQKWMTGHINSDIKKREWYRPFAPAVLFEHQSEIFSSDVFSPYMLVTTTVKENWRDKIPAVTHIDNSARHQSVTLESNYRFYKLIESFYNKTGVPVLLNTSFNGPHEPIVESPHDAIKTMLTSKLDFLVIDNYLIRRK